MSARRWLVSVVTFLPATLWYFGIFLLSHQPQLPGFGDQSWRDFLWFKTGHLVFYTVLLTLLLLAIHKVVKIWQKRVLSKKIFWIALVIVAVLAVIDEWHQSFIPGRTPRITDVLIDVLGSGAVLFVLERYNAFLPVSRGEK